MNVGDFVENRAQDQLGNGWFWRGWIMGFPGSKVRVRDSIGNEAEWDYKDVRPVDVSSGSHHCVPKSDVGKGEVFRCVTADHLRIFGTSVSLKGSFAVMEKVAMRIVHVVDGHANDYPDYSDKSCVKCRMIRAFRKSFWAVATMNREGIDQEAGA